MQICITVQELIVGAVATWGGADSFADDMMVNPFGDQAAGFAQRGFGVMDPVEGRAGVKGLQVLGADVAEFTVGGHHRPFASPPDEARLTYHELHHPAV